MRQGKNPTRAQKNLMKSWGLNYENWLVIKNTPDVMTIVHRHSNQIREIAKRKED